MPSTDRVAPRMRFCLEALERRLFRSAAPHLDLYLDQLPREPGDYIYGIANFSDSDPDHAHIAATIDWGDGGAPQSLWVTDGRDEEYPDAPFEIDGAHTFPAMGGYTVSLTVTRTDDLTGQSQTFTATTDIAVSQYDGEITWLNPQQPFFELDSPGRTPISRDNNIDATLATFAGTLPADQYHATIDWSDGESSLGVITTAPDGRIEVKGSHSYAQPGFHFPTVRVTGSDHSSGSGFVGVVTGVNPMLAEGGGPVWGAPSQPLAQALLTGFFDIDPPSNLDVYTVQIDWGDGTTSPGQVIHEPYASPEEMTVTGHHTYATEGSYTITTTTTRNGTTVTATTPARISRPTPGIDLFNDVARLAITPIAPSITHADPPPSPLAASRVAGEIWRDPDDLDGSVGNVLD